MATERRNDAFPDEGCGGLERGGNWWDWFWFSIVLAFTAIATVVAFITQRELTTTPRGVVVALLVVAYLAWDWQVRFRWGGRVRRSRGWSLLVWGVILALSLALVAFSSHYIVMFWILGGESFFLLQMPLGALGALVTILLTISIPRGGLPIPHWPQNVQEWGAALIGVLGVGVWIMIGVSLQQLFRARIRNERLIRELRASQEQLRQAAVQERELAALRERERLGRDLHDVVGHALVLVAVKIEAAQRLARVDQQRAAAELSETKELVRETMDELRRAVASLRAAPLDRQSLAAAIEERARETATQSGLRARIHVEEVGGLSAAREDALWRVTQEALTNVVKHAGASEVEITLARREGRIMLDVRDNGHGAVLVGANGDARGAHFGIRGMHERMDLVGGRLAVTTEPDGGTRVHAELPVDGEGSDDG